MKTILIAVAFTALAVAGEKKDEHAVCKAEIAFLKAENAELKERVRALDAVQLQLGMQVLQMVKASALSTAEQLKTATEKAKTELEKARAIVQ